MSWGSLTREERTDALRHGAAQGLNAVKLARSLGTAPAAIEAHAAKFGIAFADDSKVRDGQPPADADRRPKPSAGSEPTRPTEGGRHEVAKAPVGKLQPAPMAQESVPARRRHFEGVGWTSGREAALPELYREGLSAAAIAAVLGGGLSRNAVIGKIHRTHLRRPASKAAHKPPRSPAPRGARNAMLTLASAKAKAEAHMRPAPPPKRTIVDVPEPVSLALRLEQTTDASCKWPTGDAPPFSFCGAQVMPQREGEPQKPYCEHHCLRAYQPLDGRQKRIEGMAAVFR